MKCLDFQPDWDFEVCSVMLVIFSLRCSTPASVNPPGVRTEKVTADTVGSRVTQTAAAKQLLYYSVVSLLCKTSSQLTTLKLRQCRHNNGKWLEVGQFSVSFPIILKPIFFSLQIKSKTPPQWKHVETILLVEKVDILMFVFIFLCLLNQICFYFKDHKYSVQPWQVGVSPGNTIPSMLAVWGS